MVKAQFTQWCEYDGQRILVLDCRDLSPDDQVALLDEAAVVLPTARKPVRVLANVSEVSFGRAFMSRFKSLGKEVFADHVERSAIVGIEGLKRVLLDAYNRFAGRNLQAFNTEAEALRWLTE